MVKIKTNFTSLNRVVASYPKAIRQATMRAINRSAKQATSQFNREIKKVFNFPLWRLKDEKKVKLSHASMTRLKATLSVTGDRQNLIEFTSSAGKRSMSIHWRAARDKSYSKRGVKGVKVKVFMAGGWKVIPRTFISPGENSGKPLVYWRVKGGSGKSGLVARHPIKGLHGPSMPQMFNNKKVFAGASRYYASQYEKNFNTNLQKVFNAQNKKIKRIKSI